MVINKNKNKRNETEETMRPEEPRKGSRANITVKKHVTLSRASRRGSHLPVDSQPLTHSQSSYNIDAVDSTDPPPSATRVIMYCTVYCSVVYCSSFVL